MATINDLRRSKHILSMNTKIVLMNDEIFDDQVLTFDSAIILPKDEYMMLFIPI